MAQIPSAFSGPTAGSITAGSYSQSAAPPWLPSDNALLAATCDPFVLTNSLVLTAGTVYLAKLPIRSAITITNIWLGLITVGAGASTGSFVGVYNSAGTLLSGSADVAASFTTTAQGISNALTTPQAVAAGSFVWVTVLANLATTQPALVRGIGGSPGATLFQNVNLTAATARFATNGTVLTALPASITPASNAQTSGGLWVGVS